MKKPMLGLTILLAAAALIVAFSGQATAAVSGVCSNCHTMHYSQYGLEPGTTGFPTTTPYDKWKSGGPRGALVANSCLGCHTTDGTDPYDSSNYPFVKSEVSGGFDDDNCLSGGFFAHNDDDEDDNKGRGHSLESEASPPGYASGDAGPQGDWYKGTVADSGGLACAGERGCHGIHDVADEMAAIEGGHHAPEADVYRILYVNKVGVKGDGADDYEEELIKNVTETDTTSDTYDHNVYSAGASDVTISELCANCHGDFHGADDTSVNDDGESPFERHPSDADLPDPWELGTTTKVASDYIDRDRKYNPLGFPSASETGDPMVTCLSCHRAHGTENLDLLRFPYSSQLAGQASGSEIKYGCLGCHDRQR